MAAKLTDEPVRTVYELTEDRLASMQAVLVLDYMLKTGKKYSAMLLGSQACLQKPLSYLKQQGEADLADGYYVVTSKGEDRMKNFRMRYTEYLRLYDPFGNVNVYANTVEDRFAFSQFFQLDGDLWEAHLAKPDWKDLRIAVAQYKKLDPMDIVFMSYVNEGRFPYKDGWEVDSLTGDSFADIANVCNNALHWYDLGGEDVIREFIAQGMQLGFDLKKEEAKRREEWEKYQQQQAAERADAEAAEAEEEVVEEVTTITTIETVYVDDDYYDYYYNDPFYVSPIWFDDYYYPPAIMIAW